MEKCPKCGSQLVKEEIKEDEWRLRCEHCNIAVHRWAFPWCVADADVEDYKKTKQSFDVDLKKIIEKELIKKKQILISPIIIESGYATTEDLERKFFVIADVWAYEDIK